MQISQSNDRFDMQFGKKIIIHHDNYTVRCVMNTFVSIVNIKKKDQKETRITFSLINDNLKTNSVLFCDIKN